MKKYRSPRDPGGQYEKEDYGKGYPCIGAEAWVNRINDWEPWASVSNESMYQSPEVQRSITSMVIEDVLEREKQGYATYGETLTANTRTFRDSLWEAYEELLDAAQYLRAAIEALDNGTSE